MSARVANREEMVALVADTIAQQAGGGLARSARGGRNPGGPINRISQALEDVQAQHRQMVRTIAGVPLVGSPVRLDGARAIATCRRRRLASTQRRYWKARTRAGRSRAAQVRGDRRLVALADLAGARDQQVELVLATILDQHLRGADQIVGRQRIDGDEIELARIARVGPFDLIFARRLRSAAKPATQRARCPPPRSGPACCRRPSGS